MAPSRGVKGGPVRIGVRVDNNTEAGVRSVEGSIKRLEDAGKKYQQSEQRNAKATDRSTDSLVKYSTAHKRAAKDTDGTSKSVHGLSTELINANARMTAMKNIVSVVKWPAMISGAGYAAQGLGSVAAGAVAVTGALAPLSGALAVYPALFGAMGQAAGVLALSGLGELQEALGGNEEAFKKLSPAAKSFEKTLKGLEPQVKSLKQAVGSELFPGLEKGLKSAEGNFGVLKGILVETAGVGSMLGEKAGQWLGNKGVGKDLSKIGKGNTHVLKDMGLAGLHLADALRHVMVEAQPLIKWMADSALQGSKWVDQIAIAGRKSGDISSFFDKTKQTMKVVGDLVKNVAEGLFDIGKAGAPLGRTILKSLDESAQTFSQWTSSMHGRNVLKTYFEEAKPGLFEVGRLIRDATGDVLELSKGKGFYELTHSLRTELLPVVAELLKNTTAAFGPAIVKALVQLGKLVGTLAGTSGPLTLFVNSVTNILEIMNGILNTVPGLKGLIITLAGIATVNKALKFTGMVTGLTSALGIAKKILVTFGLIEEASAAGGATSAVGGLLGKGASAEKGAATSVEKTLATDAAGGGVGAAATTIGGAPLAAVAAPVAIAGIGAYKILNHTGHEMGDKIASLVGKDLGELLPKRVEAAINSKSIGKLDGLRKKVQQGIRVALASGADDQALAPLRDLRKQIEHSIGGIKLDRKSFRQSLAGLNSDAIAGMKHINSDLGSAFAAAGQSWGKGTKLWRTHTAEAMQGAVAAIKKGMALGTIEADKGQKEISKLLRRIKVVSGDDPFGLAKATAQSFQKSNGITSKGVQQWTKTLAGMPKAAQDKSREALTNMLKAWAQGHPKIEKQIDTLSEYEVRKFGKTNRAIVTGTGQAMENMAGSVQSGASNVGAALQNVGDNLSSALTALGATKVPTFSINLLSAASSYHHARESGNAKGGFKGAASGFLPGQGRQDTVPIMAAPGEAILNRHQQGPVNAALRNTFGYELPGLFERVQTPHYMAGGGIVHPQLTGGVGWERQGEQKGIDKVWKSAEHYLATHSEPKRVLNMLHYAEREAHKGYPYVYGGGHGTLGVGPFDCSGYVSGILGAGNFIDSPMAVAQGSGLYTLGAPGDGKYFTWGVRGSSGESAHTMMSVRQPNGKWRYFESGGSGGGAHEDSGWDGSFEHRHIPGFAKGGMVAPPGKAQEKIKKYGQEVFDPHSRHFIGWGYAKGGYTAGDVKKSGTLTPKEAAIAMLLGGFPAKASVIAAGLGTIKSESNFALPNNAQGPGGHIGLWAEGTEGFPSSAGARENPITASKAAFSNWKETGGFWQAWGQWEAEQSGLSGGGAGTYGHEFMGVAEEVIKGKGGKAAGTTKTKKMFPAGHTSAAGGTYGSKAGAPPSAGSASMHASDIKVPGLSKGSVPHSLTGIGMAAIEKLYKSTPGLDLSGKIALSEHALEIAQTTEQPLDDRAVYRYQVGASKKRKQQIQKQLKKVQAELLKAQTQKAQKRLLTQEHNLEGELTGVNQQISSAREGERGTFEGAETGEGEGEEKENPQLAKIIEEQETANRIAEERKSVEEEVKGLIKEDGERKERIEALIRQQTGPQGVLTNAISAMINGDIGGGLGLGSQTPTVAGTVARY